MGCAGPAIVAADETPPALGAVVLPLVLLVHNGGGASGLKAAAIWRHHKQAADNSNKFSS